MTSTPLPTPARPSKRGLRYTLCTVLLAGGGPAGREATHAMAQDHETAVGSDSGVRPLLRDIRRRAAAGKALIVYLATGSLGAAVVAFLLFKMMGC